LKIKANGDIDINVRTWNGDIDFNLANPGGAFKAYTGDGSIKIETPWAAVNKTNGHNHANLSALTPFGGFSWRSLKVSYV